MSIETRISLSADHVRFLEQLVEEGRYLDFSTAIADALDRLRGQPDDDVSERTALQLLLADRAAGAFLSLEEFKLSVDEMIEEERRALFDRERRSQRP